MPLSMSLTLYLWCHTCSVQRSLTEQQRATLTTDLKALNLSKYLQEVVSSGILIVKEQECKCLLSIAGLQHCRGQAKGWS